MLVLTRKLCESIMIGDEVEITVLAVMGEKVRLGITAPKSVPVFRKEIYVGPQDRVVEVGGAGESAPEVATVASAGADAPAVPAQGDVAGDDPVPLVTPDGVIGEPPPDGGPAVDVPAGEAPAADQA